MFNQLISKEPTAWPKLTDENLPKIYTKHGPLGLMKAATDELEECFRIKHLTVSEGVYLRWCVQYYLHVYQHQQVEINQGKLSLNSQIIVQYEAAVRWVHDLYVQGYYSSDMYLTDRFGLHDGAARSEAFQELFDFVNLRRARAQDIAPNESQLPAHKLSVLKMKRY